MVKQRLMMYVHIYILNKQLYYILEPIFLSKHIEALYKANNNVETDFKEYLKASYIKYVTALVVYFSLHMIVGK